MERLREHLVTLANDPDALLFTGRTGKAFHYNSWRRFYFNPAVKKAGLTDVTPHDLRATHASWVADRHGVMAAARRLGHSNASITTRHYARAVEGRDDDIATTLNEERPEARKRATDDARARQGHDGDDEDPPGVPAAV